MKIIIETPVKGHDPQLYVNDKIASHVDGFEAVDDTALEHYEDQGYLVIKGGFDSAEVEAARNILHAMTLSDDPKCQAVYYEGTIRDRLNRQAEKIASSIDGNVAVSSLAIGDEVETLPDLQAEERARYVRKFSGFSTTQPALGVLANKLAMRNVVERLAQSKIMLFQDMAMIKPPLGREKPWHQDHAYFNLPLDTRIVGVWVALDKVTPENGCMYVLAGSHKDGPRTHFMRRDWQICDTEMLGCHSTACPMDPGDVLLFDAKLPHGTPINRSDEYRWAVQLHYIPAEVTEVDENIRLDAFGNEGKNVSC